MPNISAAVIAIRGVAMCSYSRVVGEVDERNRLRMSALSKIVDEEVGFFKM